jgi:serine/threonine protein phosphatase 1
MRTFVISDIHGCNEAFRRALKKINLKKTDKLILLGDLIDRGFDSKGVLDTVLLLKEHNFNVVCLMGNHEEMLLKSIDDNLTKINWLKNGGMETLSSFLTKSIEKIPLKYIDFIKSFEKYYIQDKFIFVHAGLNMTIENPFDDIENMLWLRNQDKFYNKDWLGDRVIIHGHNPTSDENIINSIKNKNDIICIDNGSYFNQEGFGSICILELEIKKLEFIKVKNESIRDN